MSQSCPVGERMVPMPGFDEPDVESLREMAGDFLSEAQLEQDTHIVRNVALLGPESRNGYRYTSEAMQHAAALYDNRPVFIDHAEGAHGRMEGWKDGKMQEHGSPSFQSSNLPPFQRSLRDYAGKVVNPRFENERIRGDLHLIGPNAEWLLSLFEASPSDIGMSHVVLARRNHAGDEVEKIEKVVSVDIVAFPATVQSFRESGEGDTETRGHGDAANSICPACPLQQRESSHSEAETPRSPERASGTPPAAIRQALIAAIRGA